MCCFTRPVKSVSATKIFARATAKGRQLVVYSMHVNAAEPLAMVLPVPVTPGAGEGDLKFINLEKYPHFFADLEQGFALPPAPAADGVAWLAASRSLPVVQVGSYEASFVPTMKDFSRLDARFRLPAKATAKLQGYERFGFAVFKLKAGAQSVHPMAFEFPCALSDGIFFPTVHIHDGEVHAKAKFDHELYCQSTGDRRLRVTDWRESNGTAGQFMDLKLAGGIIIRDEHCYQRTLRGLLPNQDTVVAPQA